jgi:hypothetical protein
MYNIDEFCFVHKRKGNNIGLIPMGTTEFSLLYNAHIGFGTPLSFYPVV